MAAKPSLIISVLLGLTPLAADARIPRDHAQVAAFKLANPCPSTGQPRGACPGHHVDHVEPLCAGGVDRAHNMQWMSLEEHRYKTRTDVRVCRQLNAVQH